MSSATFSHAAVIGAGAMGRQIAFLSALAGASTTLFDVRADALAPALEHVRKVAEKGIERGTLSRENVDAAFARLSTSEVLDDAVADADIVIEAIAENLDAKRGLFADLDRLAPASAVLATNSSSIVSSKLANVANPGRVCNMHFFNPAMVMQLVEVVGGEHTDEGTLSRVAQFAREMGKTPVVLQKEIFGFVVNRIVGAIFDEAIALNEAGVASVEEIDTAVTLGLGHPVGPFRLLDITGIDVNLGIKELEAQETGDPSRGPSRSLRDLAAQGHLGRKTGRGFYDYGAS